MAPAASDAEHASGRERSERHDRARRPLARTVVSPVAEVEETRVLAGGHRTRPQVDVLERAPARLEPAQADAEIGDRVADRVVDAVGGAEQDEASVGGCVVAEPRQDRRQLVGAVVHLDEQARRPAPELCERPRVHDHPALDDHDRVADPLHLLEVVRRDDDPDAELRADAADEREHLCALHRIEAVGGLVEEHELGIVGDRRCELHALPLAGRHRPHGPKPLFAETDEPERVVRPLDGGAVREKVHLGDVPDEVGRGELGGEIVMLGRVADACAHVDPGCGGVPAEHGHRALVARAQPEDERDERRLAGAVRSEQAGDPGPDLGIEARERDGAPVPLDDSLRRDHERPVALGFRPHTPIVPDRPRRGGSWTRIAT